MNSIALLKPCGSETFSGQGAKIMHKYRDELEDNILMRIQHESGVIITFLTAPPEVFLYQNDLQPEILWLTDTDAYILFNEELLGEYVLEEIEENETNFDETQTELTLLQHLIRDSVKMIESKIKNKIKSENYAKVRFMKLTQEQKDVIRMELLRDIKDPEIRSKIISTAYGFAHENGEDGDLESMVSYLMGHQEKINELFNEYAMSMPYVSEFDEDISIKELAKQPKDNLQMSKKLKLSKNVRYDLLRLSLVDAIITSSECPGIDGCTSPDCCLDLGRIARQFGLITLKRQGSDDYSDRCLKYANPDLASKNAAEALEYLSFQHEVKRYANDHEAYELLIEINANPPASVRDYFNPENWRDPYDGTKSRQLALKRQIAYVLVSLAFPDSYLDHFADHVNTDDVRNADNKDDDHSNWDEWCKVFSQIGMPLLHLPKSITTQIKSEGPWTGLFGENGNWNASAGYYIAFGRNEDDVISDSISLKEYVERFPSVPEFFTWSDRSNGYNTSGGFLVRTWGLLVSQTWTFERESNEFYINVFNQHLAPFFDVPPQSQFDHVIVVYSDYNIGRYIASTDPRSWNPNAPDYGISTPLPDGYGLVDNWHDSFDHYQPRPLVSLDSDLFTPRLRSAARFLIECIRHDELRPIQTF